MKLYISLLSLLLSVATISASASVVPYPALLTSLAPAAAPVKTDSLPSGRHTVSSYRNGASIEVVVEDREIQSLKVDGKEVPEDEYANYQDRVEGLLGTNENGSRFESEMRIHRFSEGDLDNLNSLEDHFEGIGENFERMGERFEFNFEGLGEDFERMGERLGETFESLFDFDSDGNTMRFEFRGDGDGNWRMDSLGDGHSFEWHSDGLNLSTPADGRNDAEAEIREMETMIEQMERRKARMSADLERQERDLERQSRDLERQKRDLEREGRDLEREGRDVERQTRQLERVEIRKESIERREASYEVLVEQLQREGLLEDSGRLRKLSLDAETLKINGKKVSKEGHARFLELYEQQTGRAFGKGSSISIKRN